MDKNEIKCVTNCYQPLKNNANVSRILHPFIGLFRYETTKKENICGVNNFIQNKFMECNANTPQNNNIVDTLRNPIQPLNYLLIYYNLGNIDEVIKYINKNIDILFLTKIRILDYTYMTYKIELQRDITKWISLMTSILNEYTLSEEILVKILKKIEKYDLNIKNYPFNLLLKIKKYLDNNI